MARLGELFEVEGTCTDEDYNALKGYAENGIVTYVNVDGVALQVNVSITDGIITLRYNIFDGKQDTIQQFSITSTKVVAHSYNSFLAITNMGVGVLGEYNKPTSYSAITANDEISDAIGKLEAAISNGSSSNVYYVPKNVLLLNASATSDEILAAFGGSEKRTELANAVKEGKIIVIEGNGSAYGSAIVPHCYALGGLLVYMSFIRNNIGTSEYVRIDLGTSSKIRVIYANGFRLSSKINVLKSSSTSGEISSAIGGLNGILALKKAVEDGNTIYADADNSVLGANEISGRMQLSVTVAKYNTSYSIVISGVQSSSFYAALSASYLAIDYNTVSNTFSCQKYVIGNISIAE